MGIDLKDLPLEYQRQATRQMRESAAEIAAKSRTGGGKYKNIPTTRKTDSGRIIRFDSKKEAQRYDELMLLLKAGKIRDLRLQPQFTLQEAYTTPDGKRVRAMRYVADFMYERIPGPGEILPATTNPWIQGLTVVEDVKSSATKTHVYEIKKKLLRERLMIEIAEV